jgi:hypothetical protein
MERLRNCVSRPGVLSGRYFSTMALLLALAWPGRALAQAPVANASTPVVATPTPQSSNADATGLSVSKPAATTPPSSGAFPATQINAVLPKWLRFSGEYRMRPEEHTAYSFAPANNDAFFLSRLKLNIEVKPTSWMSTFVQAQDSEAVGIRTSHITQSVKDVFDLHQAYIQVQNGENAWIQFRAGRQDLRYGQERLIGISDWTNAPRVYDGFRLIVGPSKDHVDVFSTSVVVNNPIAFDRLPAGLHFHGVYGSLSSLVPKASVEPFVLWKDLPSVKSEEGTFGRENLWTYGFRWTGKLPGNFDYMVETAKQSGKFSADAIRAWAGYANVGYIAVKIPLKPRFLIQYDYASGDNTLKDGKVGRFDQLYPSNHDVFGLVDLLGWQNIIQIRAGVEVHPMDHLTVNFDYRDLQLATGHDSLYSSTGSVLVKTPATGALHTDVGQEPDLLARYDLRANVTVGAGYGYLFAGRFLKENSPGDRATIDYAFATYRF